MRAFLCVHADLAKEEKVMEKIKGMEYVKEVLMVYSIYDLFVELEGSDDNIKDVVREIRKLDGVRSTLILVVV
jgi:hypothetical protein